MVHSNQVKLAMSPFPAHQWNSFFFFGFVCIGVWTQGFTLARQALFHLSHSTSPFVCSGYFGNRVSVFSQACLDLSPVSVFPPMTGMTGECRYTQLLVEMRVSWSFCPNWPWTVILPISAFQVSRITGISHHTLLITIFLSSFSKHIVRSYAVLAL
jgi:hypothetical protein